MNKLDFIYSDIKESELKIKKYKLQLIDNIDIKIKEYSEYIDKLNIVKTQIINNKTNGKSEI